MGWIINPNDPDQTDSTTTKILAPDLIVTKKSTGEVLTGSPITFTIEATNVGN